MKKTLKILAVIALLLIVLLGLTGCGKEAETEKEKEKDENIIVATKETNESGITYEEKIEIKLEKDKVDSVKWTMKFEDQETATEMKQQLDLVLNFSGEDLGIEIEQNNKEIIMKLDAEQYAAMSGEEMKDVSKDELKADLEEEGYTVK